MRLGWTRVIDVQHFMPVRDQPIRNQHTMAAEVNAFSAHICRARMLSHCDQVSDRMLELGSQHVVGVVAEAGAAQRDVRGIITNLFAATAESFHPDILDTGFW